MTLEEITKLEEKLSEIDSCINELIDYRWRLVDPTAEEVQTAENALTDDPLNTLPGVLRGGGLIGKWLIPDDVLVQRRMNEEDKEGNPTGI